MQYEVENNNSERGANLISSGSTIYAQLATSNDKDYFYINAAPGLLTINFNNPKVSSLSGPHFAVRVGRDFDGDPEIYKEFGFLDKTLNYILPAAGKYYIGVVNPGFIVGGQLAWTNDLYNFSTTFTPAPSNPTTTSPSNEAIPSTGKSAIPISGVVSAATVHGSDFKDSITGADNVSQTAYLYGGDDLFVKVSSSTTSDTIYGGDGNDYLAPGAGKNFVYGGAGDDLLNGSSGQNFLYGEDGNDLFYLDSSSTGWDDTVDGGAGTDTAEFLSLYSFNMSIQRTAAGQTKLIGYAENSLTLENIERLKFINKAIAFDAAASAGQAYRLYKAAFNRDPHSGDPKGLGYWIGQMDRGMSLQEVSARFVDSNEFRTLYGTSPTNEQFLTKLYTNVLGRQPEASGYNWWLNQLNTNPEKTKAKVLADFAESAENQTGVVSLIGNGITYEPWVG